MPTKTIYTDSKLEIIRQMRCNGLLAVWKFLCTAKEKQKDSYFTYEQLKHIGYSNSAVKKHLKRLKELGWAFTTKNGKIVLKSYQKIAIEYGVDMPFRKRRKYSGETQKEILARASSVYAIYNIHKQQKHLLKGSKERYKATFSKCYTEGVCLSVNWLQGVLGFKTKSSGSNYFIYMEEQLKVLKRAKQHHEYIGNVKNVGIDALRELPNAYLSKAGGIYECKPKLIKTV